MGYDWVKNSENARAPKLERREHDVQISRIVFENHNGPFRSESGDPQIMLIFADHRGHEAAQMYTLSEKAVFKLAILMSCCDPPINMQRLRDEDAKPEWFANKDFATNQLVGRKVKIAVRAAKNNPEQDDIDPLRVRGDASATMPPGAGTAKTASAPPPTTSTAAQGAPPPPPESDGPPPMADEAPSLAVQPMTRNRAWEILCGAYETYKGDDLQARRNEAWSKAIRKIPRPEKQFTAADWETVAREVGVPF